MTHAICPRCTRPLQSAVDIPAGSSLRVCPYCRGFLQASADGFRSLTPGDLERLPEEARWQLLRARAELRAPSQ